MNQKVMISKNKYLLAISFAFISIFLFVKCTKNNEEANNPSYGFTTLYDLHEFYEKYGPKKQTFYYDIGSLTIDTLVSLLGTKIVINPEYDFYYLGGGVVTGEVQIDFIEAYSKKDILLTQRPTLSDENLLESAGVFYFKITKDGEWVSNEKIEMIIPTETINSEMQLFVIPQLPDTTISWSNWVLPSDSSYLADYDNYNYIASFTPDNFNWINCDYFLGIDSSAIINVVTQGIREDYYQHIYVVFSTLTSIIQLFDWDNNDQYTSSFVPSGLDITIIGISVHDNVLYTAINETTTGLNQTDTLNYIQTTESELIELLEDL